mgnify:CR=1 FL=1
MQNETQLLQSKSAKKFNYKIISVTNLRIHFLKGFWFINQGTIDSPLVFELKRKEVIIKRYNIGTPNQSIDLNMHCMRNNYEDSRVACT